MISDLIRIAPWTGPHNRLARFRDRGEITEFEFPQGDRILECEAKNDARNLVMTRKVLCTMHSAELVYSHWLFEQGSYTVYTFPTDLGYAALDQLNQGLTWSVTRQEVDLEHSRGFWERFLGNPRYDRDDLRHAQAIKHKDFLDVWPRLAYRIMTADCHDGVWTVPIN